MCECVRAATAHRLHIQWRQRVQSTERRAALPAQARGRWWWLLLLLLVVVVVAAAAATTTAARCSCISPLFRSLSEPLKGEKAVLESQIC